MDRWGPSMTVAALVTLVGVWIGESSGRLADSSGRRLIIGFAVAIGIMAITIISGRARYAALVVLMVAGYARSGHEWTVVAQARLGAYEGDVVIRSDPRRVGKATRIIVDIDGQRFDVWGYGAVGTRLGQRDLGEVVWVSGERRPWPPESARRRQIRHVVGRFDVHTIGSSAEGPLSRASPLLLAAHRIRTMLENGSRTLAPREAALFAGLVYGDDGDQPADMIDRFRRSGLAHLTAVSGQNVAYVLALTAPLVTRLRRPVRWVATLAVLGWFTVLTRFEPSVIRAGLMAAVAATVFACGKQSSSRTVLGLAVTVGLLVDPFLAWSVGWWLSVCGTTGLIVITPILARSVQSRRSWVVQWVTPMLGAQIGVLPVSIAVFGVPNALSIPCNLLAVPVAGLVMLIGLPAALVAGWLPSSLAHLVMWPLGVGVRWVDTVAGLGSGLRPPASVDLIVASTSVAAFVTAAWRGRRSVTT